MLGVDLLPDSRCIPELETSVWAVTGRVDLCGKREHLGMGTFPLALSLFSR